MLFYLFCVYFCLGISSICKFDIAFAEREKKIVDSRTNNKSYEDSNYFNNATNLVKTESLKWLRDDWLLGNSNESLFSFVTDARWNGFPLCSSSKFELSDYSLSFSLHERSKDEVSFDIASADFLNITSIKLHKHYLEPNYASASQWFHYSVLRKNDSVEVTDIKDITKVHIGFYPTKFFIRKSAFLFKTHTYEFKYSEETNVNDPSRITLTNETCLLMFVSVDTNCFLNITLIQNNLKHDYQIIDSSNENQQLKKWKEVRIDRQHKGTATLLLSRGRYDDQKQGFWAIDGFYRCSSEEKTIQNTSQYNIFDIVRCHPNCESCDSNGDCVKCKTGFFGFSCSEKLPRLLWPPAVVLPTTQDKVTITLENSEHDNSEIQPNFFQIQYKRRDSSNDYEFLPVQAFTESIRSKPIEIKTKNAMEINEIKVILMVNPQTYDENVPITNPQHDLIEVSCENSVIRVLTWNDFNCSNNFTLEYECIPDSLIPESIKTTQKLFYFENSCLSFTLKLYDLHLPSNRMYLKRKISGRCETQTSHNIAVLGALITLIIALTTVCTVGAIFLYGRFIKKIPIHETESMKMKENSVQDEAVLLVETETAEIQVNEFDEKLETMLEEKIKTQFDSLLDLQITKARSVGLEPQNVNKNRDRNSIVPYDDNRVILQEMHGVGSEDYINASYIDGYDRPRAYIACQGPKYHTVRDFWRMLWQENVNIVIMTTDLVKNKERHCAEYWPQNCEVIFDCGEMIIKCVSVSVYELYCSRQLEVCYENQTRTIVQYHSQWDIENVNCYYPNNILPIVTIIRQFYEKSSTPIVIHSRYGNEQVAVLILCDLALQVAKTELKIDFCGLGKFLIEQRPKMLTHVNHFILAHFLANEYLNAQKNPFLNPLDLVINSQLVQTQFEHLEKLESSDRSFEKHLLIKKEEDDSFFTAVPRYGGTRSYLIIQDPADEDLKELWMLVGRKYARCVLFLNKKPTVWTYTHVTPTETIRVRHIKNIGEETYYVVTEVSLLIYNTNSRQILYDQNVYIYVFKKWKPDYLIPTSLEDFVLFLKDFCKIEENHIVISCADGLNASGLFTVLAYIFEKYKRELEYDICNAIRVARRSRKKFIATSEQLKFIYTVIKDYTDNYEKYNRIQE